ncbi:GPW/gp25 family protein [Trichothermofontia sp.]
MAMQSDFLGVGWSSPVTLTPTGQIHMAEYDEAVRQSIWMILSTARGERVMRPDFGCGIYDLVFTTNATGTLGQISNEVEQALTRWEPRIDLLDIQVVNAEQEPTQLLIQIHYRVRTTNNRFNLVYPFYIE